MEHSTKVKKAWGKDYSQVKHDMDKYGWYNGSNDKVKKTFTVEVVWAGRHVRPISLTDGHKPKKEEVKESEVPTKE